MMQNRLRKTLLCSASKLRIYSRRQEQQFHQNSVVAMSFVSSSSSFSGGVWGRRRVIRESFVDDDVAFHWGRMRSLCCHPCGNNDNNSEKKRGGWNATTTTTFRRKFTSASSDENEQYSFAIVGSGPAGMYAADKLLHMKSNSSSSSSSSSNNNTVLIDAKVDVYEKECFPYGLVRFGVAPDHQATKNVANKFDALLRDERVRLFANVKVGPGGNENDDDDEGLRVSTKELLERYSGVVLAHGAADNDRKLQIENEDTLRGVYGARQFVNWYNGLPSAAPMRNKEMHEDIVDRLQNKKNGSNVVIVGVGNVTLDCARILLRSPEELKETDIASHALEALEKANVNSVTIVGRRSVAQAKFSPKELREVLNLPDLDVQIDDLEVTEEDIEEMNASRPRRRAFEVLEKAKKEGAATKSDGDDAKGGTRKILRVLFLRSPTGLLPEDDISSSPSSLGFVKIRKNILQGPTGNRQATLSNDQVRDETILPCDILIRSVGYVGDKLEPNLVPSDKNGTIVHDGLGRVRYNEDSSASATGRLYVCGWAKRGASGVIATNVQCAEETAEAIKEDILNGLLKPAARILPPPPSNTITASKWFKLDAVERGESDREETEEEDVEEKSESNKKALNVRSRKPRTKIVDRDRALAIVRAAAS
jgi:adrenodoxin-NADP+ reductase